jgi:hypothetical protein
MFNFNQLTIMKKSIILLFAFVVAAVAVAQQLASTKPAAHPIAGSAFLWAETTFDFGKINVGVPVTHKFTFSNSGSESLVITSVTASCGCTVAEYSKDPIPAGGSGFVKATYNAVKPGVFSKTVTINANTDEAAVLLTIKGEVVE